jgi:TolB protein
MQNAFVRFQADPTWARPGDRFAFVAMDAGFFRDSVVVIDFHDYSATYLSSGGESSFHPTFSPDGNSIIYTAPQQRRRSLYRWGGKTTSPQPIRSDDHIVNPAWSPDGDKLVYTARRDNRDQLYLLDLTTNTETHLMHDPSVREGAAAVWSPDGRYIAYAARESIAAPRRLYLIDTHDDNNRVWRLLDADNDAASHLAWSGDGRWLAFRADLDGNGMTPHIINIDTGERLPLPEDTTAGITFAGFASW